MWMSIKCLECALICVCVSMCICTGVKATVSLSMRGGVFVWMCGSAYRIVGVSTCKHKRVSGRLWQDAREAFV